LILTPPANTQPLNLNDEWRWAHFTTVSGLPSDTVVALVESADGVVWVSTDRGVAWFDGFRWHPVGEEQGLPRRAAQALMRGFGSSILVLVDGRLFEGNLDGFKEIPIGLGDGPVSVRAAASLETGELCVQVERSFYCSGRGELALLGMPQRSEEFVAPSQGWDGAQPALWKDSRGSVWIADVEQGLLRWTDRGWKRVGTGALYSGPVALNYLDGNGLAFFRFPRKMAGLWEWFADGLPRQNKAEGQHLVLGMDISPDGLALVVYEPGVARLRKGRSWFDLEIPEHMQDALFIRFRDN
jgi:hypothetical protein